MQKHSQYRYALRKLSVGLTSVAVGLAFMATTTTTAHADSEPQVQTTENQTSENKNEITVIENTNDNLAKVETINSQDNSQDDKTSQTTTETKTDSDVDTTNVNQDLKNDQNTVDNETNTLKQGTDNKENNISDATISGQQPVQTEKKIDANLVKSVTDSLKQVKYDAFDGDPKQVLRNWNHIQLTSSSLADSFNEVYNQLPTLVPQLLEHTDNIDTASQRVSDNAGAIMVGMSYINRWYNVSYGDKQLLPVMMFDPKGFGSNLDSIDWLSKIGDWSTDELSPSNTVTAFNNKLAPLLNTQSDLVTFLGDLRKKWAPDLSDEEWFRSNTGVHIVEIPSKEAPDLNLNIYHRLSTNKDLQEYILPLLNVKNDDMYVVSALGIMIFGSYEPYIDVKYHRDPVVYQEKVQAVHKELTRLSIAWRDHFDFWYRMANEAGKKRLSNANIQIWDSYNAIDSSKKGGRRWLNKRDTDIPAVAEFFGPLGKIYDAAGLSADAVGNAVRYYVAQVANNFGGIGILSHEMTHNFDNSIYLDGFQHRPGTGVETYATGLLESPSDRTFANYGLNTALTFYADNNRTTNKSPSRFQTRKDLQDYMHGVFDVTYLLDYAEAQAMVGKSAKDKQLMYSQISYDPTKKADVVSGPISTEIADKLMTIDDFIDNNIIASRGYQAGSYGTNSYQTISMYAPDYAAVQSSTSVSGGITFKKTAFELLAAKGWSDGFISYVTNKYAKDAKNDKKSLSDTYALAKIFNGEYDNDYAIFKKAMFKERIDKRQDFKPITITLNSKNVQLNNWDELQNLMQTTVDQELALRAQGKKSSLINDLKAAILTAELKQTDDFRSSIFANAEQSKHGEILDEGTKLELPVYDLDSLKKGESVGEGTKLELPVYDLDLLKKGETVGEEIQMELPAYDLDSLKKGESIGEGTQVELPAYDLDLLKKGESVGEGTKLELPSYDLDSLKKSEAVGEGTQVELPTYDLDSLKKGEAVGEGTQLELPAHDLDSLKKSESVGDGTQVELPTYDSDSLKKGEAVGEGTQVELPSYDLDSLKKGKVVGEGTQVELPTYDLDSLKKGETVSESTKLELPAYDLDLLKKGETVGEGTQRELPAYNLDSFKKGESVGEGTKLELPSYDLDSLKKGETVSESTKLELPAYDLDSLKKSESVGEGTQVELPTYDLDFFKKGETVSESTKLELPAYDLDSLKKGESVGEGTQLELPAYDLDLLKKGEAVGEGTQVELPTYDLNSLKKGESVGDGTKLELPAHDLDSLKKNKTVSEDSDSNFYINDSKKSPESTIEKLPVQNNNSVIKLDALENKQNHQPKTNDISATLSASKLEIPEKNLEISMNNKFTEISNHKNISSGINNKMNNGYIASNSRNNASLPQAGSKNNSTILVLAGISSLFTALGLSIFKKKTK
ncbi:YSIRK-type signal peptide-containing protein [Lactobacillus johnsonii]|uniref:ZmpA/ZmpB/ZmpC family metallo-endopeptidase n=1 Tax=Lactobacillus johnsonii TaxID=33959 RepID=UPI0021A38670|nr:ZmpA/ZmpB/ZmpC family metallo-endopeptidase [Lactobacillus johnsonii]MCT3383301.1 YSIRK-type signal peptide-containing protein [Lactobacillus johnsonii]MCT3386830.1 YSIRK-type signal peptide-containing protein [Lactobacillus johnsonii]